MEKESQIFSREEPQNELPSDWLKMTETMDGLIRKSSKAIQDIEESAKRYATKHVLLQNFVR